MESSMKVMVLVLAGAIFALYLHALRNRKEFYKVLVDGAVIVNGEPIELSQILFQARFFLIFVLCVNMGMWLLCFIYLHHGLGGAGCAISFLDFILNNEVVGRLTREPYSETGASRVLWVFYAISVLYLGCLATLIFFIAQA
jgi:hypothetical protein